MSIHVHPCPECYETPPCDMPTCSIVTDLERDDGTHSGGYDVCDRCLKSGAPAHRLLERRAELAAEIEQIDARLRELDGRASAPREET